MRRAVGYVRVSTGEQTYESQVLALESAAASRGMRLDIVSETASGRRRRTKLDELERSAAKRSVRELWIVSLDRLGRSTLDVLLRLDRFSRNGCVVVSLREGLDLGSAAGRLQAQLLAAFAEFEASIISSRTKAGLAAARARGARLGRPRAPIDEARIDAMRQSGARVCEIARALRVSRATVLDRLSKKGASFDASPGPV